MRRLHYDTIDSTNSQAQRLIEAGELAPLIVTAAVQSAGRGRIGRTWQSPRGGAWMSVIWQMRQSPEHYTAVPLIAGLATLVALRELVQPISESRAASLRIKWPNDVLLDGKKIAGILCETWFASDCPCHLVVGVGINVDFPVRQLEGRLRHPPTTLRASLGKPPPVEAVIGRFADEIERRLVRYDQEGLDPDTISTIRSHLAYVGTMQTWRFGENEITGDVEGIDSAGRLLLNVEGVTRALDYGELSSIPAHRMNNIV